MKSRLVKSFMSLALVLAIGSSATYALFTSNTVTISSNAVTTGEANIKLCNSFNGDDNWKDIINPDLSVGNLVPGGPSLPLTGADIYVGNDDGSLDTAVLPDCDDYDESATEGSSDVSMKLVPEITTPVCNAVGLEDELELEFVIGTTSSGFGSLTFWNTNTAQYGDTLAPGEGKKVVINARLVSTSESQNKTCEFDVNFTGKQV